MDQEHGDPCTVHSWLQSSMEDDELDLLETSLHIIGPSNAGKSVTLPAQISCRTFGCLKQAQCILQL